MTGSLFISDLLFVTQDSRGSESQDFYRGFDEFTYKGQE